MSARLVQVTNVSTSVTKEQLKALFTHLCRIEDVQLYPESETLTATVAAKTGYIRFDRSELAHAALNLTNTVFLDRPIICSIVKYATSSSVLSSKAIAQLCRIPDETVAIKLCPPINTNVTLIPGGITWPHNIINRIVTIPGVDANSPGTSFIETLDPNLSEKSLPAYPPLPGSMDQQKAEEIRRTVYVSNLDPRVQFAHLYELFSQIGEIRYVRLTETAPNAVPLENRGLSKMSLEEEEGVDWSGISIAAYIEFSEQPMVLKALCLNGLSFAGRVIKVNHATSAIVIPATNKQQITVDDIRKEISKLRHSSSSSHRDRTERDDRSSSHRVDRDNKDSHDKSSRRDRDRNRDRDRERDRHTTSKTSSRDTTSTDKRKQHESSSSVTKSSHHHHHRSDKKRDGSVDEKTSESDEEETAVVSGSNEASCVETDHSEGAPASPKKARHSRSRSPSKSKRETKKRSSRERSSPNRHRSSRERKRSSRSREREKRERDLLREKELREKLKASASKRSSREKEVTSRNRSSGGERASSKEHKRSNGSKAESSHKRDRERKRSSSRSGKSKKRSKSKEKLSKDHKKSSRRRSKSPREKNSSRSSHKHSKSSKSDKKESRHDKRDKHEEDGTGAVAKTRDYDEEERYNSAMDVAEAVAVQSPYGPEPANGNGIDKNQSSSDDSGSSSSESDGENATAIDEAMEIEHDQNAK